MKLEVISAFLALGLGVANAQITNVVLVPHIALNGFEQGSESNAMLVRIRNKEILATLDLSGFASDRSVRLVIVNSEGGAGPVFQVREQTGTNVTFTDISNNLRIVPSDIEVVGKNGVSHTILSFRFTDNAGTAFTVSGFATLRRGKITDPGIGTLENVVVGLTVQVAGSGTVNGDNVVLRGTISASSPEAEVGMLHATTLLSDSFDLSGINTNATDVNFQLAQRQTGLLAPVTYTKGLEPTFSQVGNASTPNELLLAGQAAGMGGAVSLDHNFVEVPGVRGQSVIQFDVNPVLVGANFNETQTAWVALTFGSAASTRNQFPQFVDGIGILFRGNGQYQAFNAGQNLGIGNYAPSTSEVLQHIRVTLAAPTSGNPFDGNSAVTVTAFANARRVFSFVRTNGFQNNYISLVAEGEGSGGDGVVRHAVDNLIIGLEPTN